MAQTDRHLHGHGDSMTNSAQWGRVGENVVTRTAPPTKGHSNISTKFAIFWIFFVVSKATGFSRGSSTNTNVTYATLEVRINICVEVSRGATPSGLNIMLE